MGFNYCVGQFDQDPVARPQTCGVSLPNLTTVKALPPVAGCQWVENGFGRYGLDAAELWGVPA